MSTRAILATHTEGAVRVFTRDEQGALAQVAQLSAEHVVDAQELLVLVSDLDLQLGWSVNGSQVLDAVRPLAEHRQLPAARGSRTGDETRAAIVERLTAEGPLTIGQLGGESMRYHAVRLARSGRLQIVGQTQTGADLYAIAPERPERPERPPRKRASSDEMAARRQRVLVELRLRGPMKQQQIADALGISIGDSTRKMLERMTAAGEIVRSRGPDRPNGQPSYVYQLPHTPGSSPSDDQT